MKKLFAMVLTATMLLGCVGLASAAYLTGLSQDGVEYLDEIAGPLGFSRDGNTDKSFGPRQDGPVINNAKVPTIVKPAPVDPTDPTGEPTDPTGEPTDPTGEPTDPTGKPTDPTGEPTDPTGEPTDPTGEPTDPTGEPTNPTEPTDDPLPPPMKTPSLDATEEELYDIVAQHMIDYIVETLGYDLNTHTFEIWTEDGGSYVIQGPNFYKEYAENLLGEAKYWGYDNTFDYLKHYWFPGTFGEKP